MKIVRSLTELGAPERDVCLAIGVFDGVHRGHQRVIRTAVDDARAWDGLAMVLTFDPHPIRVLAPDKAPRLLTSTPHKLQLIGQLGVEMALVLAFDQTFAAISAERFIEMVANSLPRLREICIGAGFRFGCNRGGTVTLLQTLAPTYAYQAVEVPPEQVEGVTISSTAIRQQVLGGDLRRAAAMLGRPFSVLGTVEAGQQLGRQLGFPTANLNPHNEVLPPNGVYAVRTKLAGVAHDGVANIGVRPTVIASPAERTLEVHLFGVTENLYGREVEVEFVEHLRHEQRFASTEALRRQIGKDVAAARALLGSS